jgi:hypothetical protein
MGDMIDIETVYRQERQRWLREEAPRRSLRDIIAGSVPYWIILVALVLYGLSAPHAASIFDKLTSGWVCWTICSSVRIPGFARRNLSICPGNLERMSKVAGTPDLRP